jgi:hypothetical protein
MLFRTTEHYPYFDDDNFFEKECLICYNYLPHNCSIQNKYNFDCECYKLVHENCLKEWYELKQKCPICRKHVYKKINYKFEIFKMFIGFLLVIDMLIKIASIIYFIYLLIIIFYIFIKSIILLL